MKDWGFVSTGLVVLMELKSSKNDVDNTLWTISSQNPAPPPRFTSRSNCIIQTRLFTPKNFRKIHDWACLRFHLEHGQEMGLGLKNRTALKQFLSVKQSISNIYWWKIPKSTKIWVKNSLIWNFQLHKTAWKANFKVKFQFWHDNEIISVYDTQTICTFAFSVAFLLDFFHHFEVLFDFYLFSSKIKSKVLQKII